MDKPSRYLFVLAIIGITILIITFADNAYARDAGDGLLPGVLSGVLWMLRPVALLLLQASFWLSIVFHWLYFRNMPADQRRTLYHFQYALGYVIPTIPLLLPLIWLVALLITPGEWR